LGVQQRPRVIAFLLGSIPARQTRCLPGDDERAERRRCLFERDRKMRGVVPQIGSQLKGGGGALDDDDADGT
jgi:hypothetical protein